MDERCYRRKFIKSMVGGTGFEPVTPAMSTQYSFQLS